MSDKKPTIDTTMELKNSFRAFAFSLKDFLIDKGKLMQTKLEDHRIRNQIKREEERKNWIEMMNARNQYMEQQRRKYYEQQRVGAMPNANEETKTPTTDILEAKQFEYPICHECAKREYFKKDMRYFKEGPFGHIKKHGSEFYKAALVGYALGVMGTGSTLVLPLISAYISGSVWEHIKNNS